MASFGGQSLPRVRSVSMNCWRAGTDAVRRTPFRVADKLSHIQHLPTAPRRGRRPNPGRALSGLMTVVMDVFPGRCPGLASGCAVGAAMGLAVGGETGFRECLHA